MAFNLSDIAKTITVFNYLADTKEFIGKGNAWLPPGIGLPAYCTEIEPPEKKDDFCLVFHEKENKWHHVEDHRGQVVHCTKTGQAIKIDALGALPDNTTPLAPEGDFFKWDGLAWINDPEAQKTAEINDAQLKKNQLDKDAQRIILLLEYAIETDMQTGEESAQLHAWKKYRVLLNRIDINQASQILWPEMPQQGA